MKDGNTIPPIPASWKAMLPAWFMEGKIMEILEKVNREIDAGKKVYPPFDEIFNAFCLTEPHQVKVVILGQDPYHGPGQAHGLCFSVKKGIEKPPSLINIFKELQNDLNIPEPPHGELTSWAKQGVFLLNAVLTVEESKPGSHKIFGWENFTDDVIKTLSQSYTGLVFLLWGSYAQNKVQVIDETKHFVLKAAHPSPLSASKGFFGCRHFSRTNEILKAIGKESINWALN